MSQSTEKKLLRTIELFHKYSHIPYFDMDDGTSLDPARNYTLESCVAELERLDKKEVALAKLEKKRQAILRG